ncbi:MAG: ATP synthase F1 subunit delta [Psittacicella sp.]
MKKTIRLYAKASYEVSLKTQDSKAWEEFLEKSSIFFSFKEINFLSKIKRSFELIELLEIFLDKFEIKASSQMKNFISILLKNKYTKIVGDIHQEFKKLRSQDALEVNLVSASILSDKQISKILEKLTKKTPKLIDLKCSIDKTLLTGFIISSKEFTINACGRDSITQLTK